jgi:hypothetical protein
MESVMFPVALQPLDKPLPFPVHSFSTLNYIAMCDSIEILITAVALLRRQMQKLFLN